MPIIRRYIFFILPLFMIFYDGRTLIAQPDYGRFVRIAVERTIPNACVCFTAWQINLAHAFREILLPQFYLDVQEIESSSSKQENKSTQNHEQQNIRATQFNSLIDITDFNNPRVRNTDFRSFPRKRRQIK